ncbi:hypothetical protein BDW69DRAFT_76774 [Aspergillus filifer]
MIHPAVRIFLTFSWIVSALHNGAFISIEAYKMWTTLLLTFLTIASIYWMGDDDDDDNNDKKDKDEDNVEDNVEAGTWRRDEKI